LSIGEMLDFGASGNISGFVASAPIQPVTASARRVVRGLTRFDVNL
jgi:hypothetical protein